MFDPQKFTTPTAKPLPVVLLLDVSSSMSGDNIRNLNDAIGKMLASFTQEEKMEVEILVSIITFGMDVKLHVPYTKASQVQWEKNLQANGSTPMGAALKMAKAMIEDKEVTPSRAYRPTIVLVSDGEPNDEWETPMINFISEGRSSKCDRMAMFIGNEGAGGETMLKRFIEGTEHKLFYAHDADKLHEFFQYLTMSVTMRTQSKNPNLLPPPSVIKQDISTNKPNIGNAVNSSEEAYW